MPAILFDLDGTLVDSVYEHVAAWHTAFGAQHIDIPAYEYHKRVGMTGVALVRAVSDAFALNVDAATQAAIVAEHGRIYRERRHNVTPIPGVRDLWHALDRRHIRWAIATSATREDADALLQTIDVPSGAVVVTQHDEHASKPAPGPFAAAAEKLGVDLRDCIVVGDAVWDMLASRRAGALGVGVLTGGCGAHELSSAGAYRVYASVGELARRFAELGL